MSENAVTYEKAGVNIDTADATKAQMKKSLDQKSSRVLNTLGAFASLVDFSYDDIDEPVIVIKMEEPGSKQLLAAQHGRLPDVGYDLIHHLINDTIMMGARPVAIQDTIVCGKLEKDTVVALVDTMAMACREQGCDLVGGETSEQPRVIPEGSYILSAACVGVVDKKRIVDGSAIQQGDVVLAVASNGVHTNGYTLIRSLLDAQPDLASQTVGDETFLDAVLKPHLCYNLPLQELLQATLPSGLAHITGGGVVDNLKRVLPEGVSAKIDLSAIDILPVFKSIAAAGNVPEADMLRTFNLGVGMIVVCPAESAQKTKEIFTAHGHTTYQIGEAVAGDQSVECSGSLSL